MKKILYLFFACLSVAISSCTKDTGNLSVTYYEATAIYGDLDEVRLQDVNAPAKEIVNPGKVYVADNMILIGEEGVGIHVIDNSNAATPVNANFINIPGNREYFVKGHFLYAESYYDVVKLDISNPQNIALVSRAKNVFTEDFINNEGETLLGFTFNQVTKEVDQNSDLYNEINNNGNTVYFDFARNIIPQSAVPASFAGNSNQSSGTVNRVTEHNGYVYIAGRFDLHVIKDDQAFNVVNKLQGVGNEMETIFPYQNKLFIGSRSSMEIYDISQPASPTHQYQFDHATSCDPVLPSNNAAYISLRTADFSPCPGNTNALVVLNIENLENPKQVAEIQMRSPYGMAMIGNRLYVGEGANGLTIFDATDQLNLKELQHDSNIQAYDVIEHPSRTDLILIAGPNGLEQYLMDGQTLDFQLESRINF